MKMRNIKLWIEDFKNRDFENSDIKTQIEAGWFDWFCRNTSLAAKTKRMGRIIKQVKAGGKVDVENWYVWFKNNCPLNGPLFDDFRFAEMESKKTMFTVQLNCCWEKHLYTVYGRRNDFKEPLFGTDSSRELVEWLNTSWEEIK